MSIYRMPINMNNRSYDRFVYDDGNLDSILCATEVDATNKNPISPDSDPQYVGCGIKAAQNFLRYFGIQKTQNELTNTIPTHSLPKFLSNQIWVYPNDLRDGLSKILNDPTSPVNNDYQINVIHDCNADIIGQLTHGFPIIALVNNGEHYIVVVGYTVNNGFNVQDMQSLTTKKK